MNDPIPQLEALKAADHQGIQGKFHSHITVRTNDLDGLQQFCRAHKVKLTVIDLDSFGATHAQRDVMTTQHHRVDSPQAVQEIIGQLQGLCAALKAHNFEVLRVKLEHESLPTLPRFDAQRYREVHIKLAVPLDAYDQVMKTLAAHASALGYVPSRNPQARNPHAETPFATQFINMRVYQGDLDFVEEKVRRVTAFLAQEQIPIREVKQETAVFDTHLAHDQWWA